MRHGADIASLAVLGRVASAETDIARHRDGQDEASRKRPRHERDCADGASQTRFGCVLVSTFSASRPAVVHAETTERGTQFRANCCPRTPGLAIVVLRTCRKRTRPALRSTHARPPVLLYTVSLLHQPPSFAFCPPSLFRHVIFLRPRLFSPL